MRNQDSNIKVYEADSGSPDRKTANGPRPKIEVISAGGNLFHKKGDHFTKRHPPGRRMPFGKMVAFLN
jgi:hypothetical protein